MLPRSRVYLDNAATSWPKPTLVYDAVDDFQRRLGVSAGRGGYTEAQEVGEAVEATRAAVARLIGAESPERIVFTLNGTDSLNLAIRGILKPGDHVVTTVIEHNSVLRPLRRLEKHSGIEVTRVSCNEFGMVSPEDIRGAVRPNTRLIVVIHASNVTGALQPVAKIGEIARERGILFLVDAAQSLGHIPFSVSEFGADLLAAPGHKGLLGPLGTGILYIRPGVEEAVNCVRQGGTGSASSSDDQPETLPEKYESGSHNAPGIIGLGAGIEYLEQRGLAGIRQHSIDLTERLLAGLSNIPGVVVYGPRSSADRIGVVSVTFAGQDTPSVANRLEEEFRIQVRGGFQCAAMMHRSLGTFDQQGTVRFSVGPFNTADDIDAAIDGARTIVSSPRTNVEAVACPCVSGVREQDRGAIAASLVLPASAEKSSAMSITQRGTDVTSIPGLQELWRETLGDPRVCIAVLDGPVDLSHAAFSGTNLKVLGNSDSGGAGAAQHGTHIASVIFGNHQSSVKGIAPLCSGVVIPIYRSRTDGSVEPCSQSNLAQAIEKAIDFSRQQNAEALVINVSGGQFSESGEAQSALKQAIAKCNKLGILVVAAAGNEGCDCLHVPGALPSVLAVGAMSANGEPLEFSNWGKKYLKQGVLAVGENIRGASPAGDTSIYSGTSFATPIVSGVAALLLCMQLKKGKRPSTAVVRRAIVMSALGCSEQENVDCRRYLAGRLSITRAIETLNSGEPTTMSHEQTVDSLIDPAIAAAGEKGVSTILSSPIGDGASRVMPASASQRAVAPSSGCGCNGPRSHTKVFAIGSLSYDFESITMRQAMQRRMKEDGGLVQEPASFMRHLFRVNPDGTGTKELNLHDANRFYWVLEYGRKPLYVVQPPQGATEADDLRSIAYDYLEQQGLADANKKLLLGTKDGPTDSADRPDFFAIAGHTTGETVTLLETGHTVPVLIPEYDLTDSWNLDAFVSNACDNGLCDKKDVAQVAQFRQIVELLHKFIEPMGDTSEKRAKNFISSLAVLIAANSVAATSKQKLVLRALDVMGSVGGRYPQDEVILVRAVYIDIANPKDVEYAIDYHVNVSQAKPYLEHQSSLGFA